MVNILTPRAPTYVKVANFPGLYRHARSGRYYGVKKLGGKRREHSLKTADRKIAERRLKEWIGNLDKVDAEVEKTTLGQLIERDRVVTGSMSESSRTTDQSIIKRFLAWWPHGRDCQVRQIRPSMLDEWLAHEEPRLRNVTYNRYAGFLKQLFDIAVKDRIIPESPAKSLRLGWKKPQTPKRIVPSVDEFERIVENIRNQRFTDHAHDTADFVEFLGLAGLGQAEASSLTWSDIDWQNNRLNIRRHKTDTRFHVPIYDHLRPLLERVRKQRRGRVSASALVFKIKDAKKALSAACERLDLPRFCQRSLRQHLIMRLWKAGVDKKLIARWQGHQDGGQLIMDTYTEVFGGDDDDYERSQLAKLAGTTAVVQPCGSQVKEATSSPMKGPKKGNALPAPNSDSAVPAVTSPVNPYQEGDRVITMCKGEEVEAEVTAVFKDEVQVKTPDGERRWRTVRTVTGIQAAGGHKNDASDSAAAVAVATPAPSKKRRATRKRATR
jgi:integrase